MIASWMSRLLPIFVLAACRLAFACRDGDPNPVAQPASIDTLRTIAPPSTPRRLGLPAHSLLLTTVSLRLPD
ncbi:MAG: hypothetical protein QOG69_2359 [Actinomycetota bacterium]|nr:hypothetical protein [Actinomycetota bacterium]MDQ1540605.1 hypothetical protein [Actinomycetota bacterium]